MMLLATLVLGVALSEVHLSKQSPSLAGICPAVDCCGCSSADATDMKQWDGSGSHALLSIDCEDGDRKEGDRQDGEVAASMFADCEDGDCEEDDQDGEVEGSMYVDCEDGDCEEGDDGSARSIESEHALSIAFDRCLAGASTRLLIASRNMGVLLDDGDDDKDGSGKKDDAVPAFAHMAA